MNSSPPIQHRFLPTLTEVVQASDLAQHRTSVAPQSEARRSPVTSELPTLARLNELLDELLNEAQDDAARAVLAPRFELLRQRLRQEFDADDVPVRIETHASGA